MKKIPVIVGGDISYAQRVETTHILRDIHKYYPEVTEILCHISDREVELSAAAKVTRSDGTFFLVHEIQPNIALLVFTLMSSISGHLAGAITPNQRQDAEL